jgi:predicted TIM-barrel fold metal-dependent hydrolase
MFSSSLLVPVPAQSCDCHVHVFEPERFTYADDRAYTPGVASVVNLQAMQRSLGMSRVVLVQPSVYGNDNCCLLDAIALIGQDKARGIAVLDLEQVSDQTLQELHAGGVRGARLNLHVKGAEIQDALRQIKAARRLAQLPGWQLQVHASLPVHVALLEPYAALGIPVVLDHFAGVSSSDPDSEQQLEQLLQAMEQQSIFVKLSAAYRLPPSCKPAQLAEKFYTANPDQVVWGSDWPHTGGAGGQGRNPTEIEPFRSIDNRQALDLILQALDSPQATQKLLVDNPTRLYSF